MGLLMAKRALKGTFAALGMTGTRVTVNGSTVDEAVTSRTSASPPHSTHACHQASAARPRHTMQTLRDKQLEHLTALLHLNSPTSSTRTSTNPNSSQLPTWKTLVLDKQGTDILSTSLTVPALREAGITLHQCAPPPDATPTPPSRGPTHGERTRASRPRFELSGHTLITRRARNHAGSSTLTDPPSRTSPPSTSCRLRAVTSSASPPTFARASMRAPTSTLPAR